MVLVLETVCQPRKRYGSK